VTWNNWAWSEIIWFKSQMLIFWTLKTVLSPKHTTCSRRCTRMRWMPLRIRTKPKTSRWRTNTSRTRSCSGGPTSCHSPTGITSLGPYSAKSNGISTSTSWNTKANCPYSIMAAISTKWDPKRLVTKRTLPRRCWVYTRSDLKGSKRSSNVNPKLK